MTAPHDDGGRELDRPTGRQLRVLTLLLAAESDPMRRRTGGWVWRTSIHPSFRSWPDVGIMRRLERRGLVLGQLWSSETVWKLTDAGRSFAEDVPA